MDRRRSTAGTASVVALLVTTWACPAAAGVRAEPLPPPGAAVTPAVPSAPPAVPGLGSVGAPPGGTQQAVARVQAQEEPMTGQFVVTDGKCGSGATPVGSYFSMLDPAGNAVDNGDSPCGDKAATPVAAGADGLTPGRMQPFAGSPGASRAIVAPTTFFGSPFAVATQGPDKQSGAAVEAPTVTRSGGKLTGKISSFQAFYNGAYYNQGAPKPGGGTPGRTTAGMSGTYDSGSGAFVLEWRSTITGGAFSNFTGVWHLAGTYKAAATGAPSSGTSPSGSTTTAGTTAGATAGATGGTTAGTRSGMPPAGPQGGAPRLADTGFDAAGTGNAALGFIALTLALWWRRAGWSS